ncbi:MAG TPA: AraC family transcriptional regulator [Sediminibacterium sp.]|nr:AraC family transcriptional regulator [Sediminibacterium sp.]
MKPAIPVKDKLPDNDLFKISRFRSDIRITSPHTHNKYFEIIYLSSGSGYHTIDLRKYPVKPPVIFLVRKDQVHHWELDDEPQGYVLILKKAFLDNSADKSLLHLLNKVSVLSCCYLSGDEYVGRLCNLLESVFSQPRQAGNALAAEGLIKALLASLPDQQSENNRYERSSQGLYLRFLDLIDQDMGIRNQVAHYAALLHTSPQNLNAACRKARNLSAAEVLSETVMQEAKRLLLYTDTSVANIAHQLSFSDASHFIKYFKRLAGITPRLFRTSA